MSESPEGREMLAKEAEWKEKSKVLKEGMTIQEVINAMGQPSHREQMPPTRDGYPFLYYLPAGTPMLAGARRRLFPNPAWGCFGVMTLMVHRRRARSRSRLK